jgi:selenophosphate synthase
MSANASQDKISRSAPGDLVDDLVGVEPRPRLGRIVTAETDVTGFGLLGHGLEMARASGTSFAFEAAALPALPGALQLARLGVETVGAAHNR